MTTALVLVDIQQDYFPGGRMEVVGATLASQAAKKLLVYFRENKLPIVHIQHISTRAGASFFLPGTEGINIHENAAPLSGETVIRKNYPNSFRDTNLQEQLELQEINQLVICGMMSHMCIDTTVRTAFDRGYSCIVAHDACATRNLVFNGNEITAVQVHGAYMAALGAVFAKVMSAEELIGMLRNSEQVA